MHIIGGVYLELCDHPSTEQIFGSGGRAALALAQVSPNVVLHTYSSAHNASVWEAFKRQGIDLELSNSQTPFAFSYFHPLSNPVPLPPLSNTKKASPIQVKGDVVLRFGMLGGEAIVDAQTAVYDPQGDSMPFAANGSRAAKLALVLNEQELDQMGGFQHVKAESQPEVMVIKRGLRGATVVADDTETTVPAYLSSRVSKIGSGDVFSAMFAYWWGEQGLPPCKAADLASRTVSQFCEFGHLPIDLRTLKDRRAAPTGDSGPILIEGAIDTLGRRYVVQEAKAQLRNFGFSVFAPCLGEPPPRNIPRAVLWIAEGLSVENFSKLSEQNVVVLAENSFAGILDILGEDVDVADDFTTALYRVGWMAMSMPKT